MEKILFVYHSSEIGGGSFCLLNLLKVIDRVLFEPIVMLPKVGPLSTKIESMGLKVVYFPKLTIYPYNRSLFRIKTILQIVRLLLCRRQFIKLLKELNPTIVYLNTMMLFPYLKACRSCGFKTVIHVREHWPLDQHTIQLRLAQKYVYNYADTLIAINSYSASIFPKKQATIVYDWIDMASRKGGITKQDILGPNSKDYKVYLFTGGAQPVKGALEVIKTFSEHITKVDRRLIVMDLTPNITWNGISGKIKYFLSLIGFKTYKEKVINLCHSDERIVCIPAEYNLTDLMSEVDAYVSYFTIPHANLALAESLIVGLPCIAAQTPESLEYSMNSPLTHLFELGNIDSFVETWLKVDDMYKTSVSNYHSQQIASAFDTSRNATVFNITLSNLI